MEILIADDEPLQLRLLARLARSLGHRARTAPDGERLREAFAASEPALVLCDVNFGAEDGIALCLDLRRRASRAAFAIMTGEGDSALRARAAGFETVLLKPIEPERLRALLGRASEPGPRP